jgi:predicted RNA methylase
LSVFPKIFLNFINNQTKAFPYPNISLEQYSTPISVLETIFGDITDFNYKSILDLGVGLGTLSFCSAWLGANNIVGIDSDYKILSLLFQNEKKFINIYTQHKSESKSESNIFSKKKTNNLSPEFTWIHSQIEFFPLMKFKNYFDLVIMNPPFGTQRFGIDFVFLQRATQLSCPIISLHKNHENFDKKVRELLKKSRYEIVTSKLVSFPLEKSMTFHKKQFQEIKTKIVFSTPI